MGTVNAVPFLFEENIMSCPTFIVFENNKEGTQKKVHINLGWCPPSNFDMAVIIINASKEIDNTYEWGRVDIPILNAYVNREDFEEMKRVVREFKNLYNPSPYIQRFTLDNILTKI